MNLAEILEQVYLKLGKDAYGNMITPDSYNEAISYTNLEILNNFLAVLEQDEEITDNLRPFIITVGDNETAPLQPDSYGYVTLPDDYIRYVRSAKFDYFTEDGTTELQYRHIEMLPNKDFVYRLTTKLFSPSLSRPICTIQNSKLLVRPQNIPYVVFTYVRMPYTPVYDYDFVAETGLPIYRAPGSIHTTGVANEYILRPGFDEGDPSISVEFEWTPDVHNDLVNILFKYFAINLKDFNSLSVSEIEKGLQ
jgi:hypothetical protein